MTREEAIKILSSESYIGNSTLDDAIEYAIEALSEPTTITDEQAIDQLQSSGWMQRHERAIADWTIKNSEPTTIKEAKEEVLMEILNYTYGMLTAEKFGLQQKIASMLHDIGADSEPTKTGTDEMWQEFESQLLREIHTPMTMDYDSSIRMAEMGIKEVLNKWKYRLSEPKTDVLDKVRAEIESKCDRIYNLISIYPYAERRDIQEMLCEIMDLCDAESEHKRLIDADELLKRIAEKCKTPSLSEDTVNGLCGANAIIYGMLDESGKEK